MSGELRYEVPFYMVPDELVKDERTTVYHQAVFGVIAMHAGKDGRSYPSVARMGRLLKASPTKIRATVSELSEMGWLRVQPRVKEETGEQTSNLYTLAQSCHPPTPDAGGVPHQVEGGTPPGGVEPDPLNQIQLNQNSPDHMSSREVTDYFLERYQEKTGRKPLWGHHGVFRTQAPEIAGRYNRDDIMAAVDLYFNSSPWYTKDGRSWAQFYKHADELVSMLPRRKTDEERAESARFKEVLSG